MGHPMALTYLIAVICVLLLSLLVLFIAYRRKKLEPFSISQTMTLATFACLLYVASLPWRLGLSRFFLGGFFITIPYTAILLVGLRMVPRFGTPTLMVLGYGLLSQVVGSGINPLWWPEYLAKGAVLEAVCLLAGDYGVKRTSAVWIGTLYGGLGYAFFYLVSAPLIWHMHYDLWFIAWKVIQGIAAGAIGSGVIGYDIAGRVERVAPQASF
jgi:hypothetical protein